MGAWQLFGYLVVLSIVIIVWIAIILYILRTNRRRAAMAVVKGMPVDHMSLYFDEYFPTMIKSFDLVTKSRYDDWAASIEGRLRGVDESISTVQSHRKRIDQRLTKVEGRIEKLEKA